MLERWRIIALLVAAFDYLASFSALAGNFG